MKKTVSVAAVLAAFVVAPTAVAQEPAPSDPSLPFSLGVAPGVISTPGAERPGMAVNINASFRISPKTTVGFLVSGWGGAEAACVGPTVCGSTERSLAATLLVDGRLFPFGRRYAFVRIGLGVSLVSEQVPSGSLIIDSTSVPFTALLGIGSDLHLTSSVFVSPFANVLYVSDAEDRLATTPIWLFQVGAGITVG